jgi:hypothetical protein
MKNNHDIKMMTPFTILLLLVIGLGVILMFYRLPWSCNKLKRRLSMGSVDWL